MFAEELREHFGTYGEIESINVKTDPTTGRSRGFAFIVFSQSSTIDKVCFYPINIGKSRLNDGFTTFVLLKNFDVTYPY